MKKSLIALAVAGALTAPMVAQADATLYGIAQFRLIDEDSNDLEARMAKTRLGVKGTVDNDIEGLTTGYQFEWEFDGNGTGASNDSVATMRKSHVFMEGGFGKLDFGRQNNPAASVKKGDIFGHNSAALTELPDRLGSAVVYVTPSMGGFSAYGGFAADNATGTDDDDIDASTIGLDFSAGGLGLAVSYYDLDETSDTTSVGASYSMDALYVGGSYQRTDYDAAGTDESDYFQLAGAYTIGKTTLALQYEEIDNADGVDGSDEEKIAARVAYALGASAGVAVEYADYDEGNDNLVLEYTLSF